MEHNRGYQNQQGGRGGNPSRSGNDPQKSLDQIWPSYLKDGYFDEAGNLRLDLVRRDRMKNLADKLGQYGLTSTQVRRFFSHCRALEARLRAGAATWEDIRADFLRLDAAAAYSLNKTQQAKIPCAFHDFIRRNVEAVRTERDFLDGFMPHFEALIGFGEGQFKKGGA